MSWENAGSCSYCITWLNTLCGLSTMCNYVWTGILGSSMTDLPELWFPQFLVMIVAPPDHTFLTNEQCSHHWQNCIFQWPWRGKHSHAPWTIARKKQWYVNQRFSVDFTRVTKTYEIKLIFVIIVCKETVIITLYLFSCLWFSIDIKRTKIFIKWLKVDCGILRLKVGHAIVFGF